VTDWRSATPEMRFFSIDSYLADLNVVVDELGGCANLIGVCQGGWMAQTKPSDLRVASLAGTTRCTTRTGKFGPSRNETPGRARI
jgi:hypothetical protein